MPPADPPRPARSRAARPSADATRERILDAALDLFADRSFDGASTRDIAARAGVSQPSLAYHFQDKEALWQAAVDRLFAKLNDLCRAGSTGCGASTTSRRRSSCPRLHRLLRRQPAAPPHHHPGEQGRGRRIDWLVDEHVRPLYDPPRDVRAPRGPGCRPRHPDAAPLLHPDRRRPDDLRPRSRMPAPGRVRPAQRRGHRDPRRRGDRTALRPLLRATSS